MSSKGLLMSFYHHMCGETGEKGDVSVAKHTLQTNGRMRG
jgi:hypothetical protein